GCVRGTLWGEAFFAGRPTSYWRTRIDRWQSDIQLPDDLNSLRFVFDVNGLEAKAVDEFDALLFNRTRRPPTLWERVQLQCGIEVEQTRPKILRGEPDSDAVLLELGSEPKYANIATAALE